MNKPTKALKSDWNTKDLISYYEVTWIHNFSDEICNMLRLGSIPQSMEHKWFIYEENNIVHFHRSWTGNCVYELILNPITNQHLVRVNVNPEEYNAEDDNIELKKLETIIYSMHDQYKLFLLESANIVNNN